MRTIEDLIKNRTAIKIDKTYQREGSVWKPADKKCLIDTILRNEPMPLFIFNKKGSNYDIVDGQQRYHCICEFYDNRFSLGREFSGKDLDGSYFNSGKKILSKDDQDKFLNYEILIKNLDDYDDEKVRVVFSRLQRGRPLNDGEKLNALPGSIVLLMRDIINTKFFQECISIPNNRYEYLPNGLRVLLYEYSGVQDSGSRKLFQFCKDLKSMEDDNKCYKKALKTLNILYSIFKGKQKLINRWSLMLAIYGFISELMQHYVEKEIKEKVYDFLHNFMQIVEDASKRNTHIDTDYRDFFDALQHGFSAKLIRLRRDILIKKFKEQVVITELDESRQISSELKRTILLKRKNCENCGKLLCSEKEADYHHKIRYTDGGESVEENIELLCKVCHKKADSHRAATRGY